MSVNTACFRLCCQITVNRVNVLRCEHRTELSNNDYWLGLDIVPVTEQSPTAWYDGNPSTYRNWANSEPSGATTCISFTNDGFKDRPCSAQYHFICKKPAGDLHKFYYYIISIIYFYRRNNRRDRGRLVPRNL